MDREDPKREEGAAIEPWILFEALEAVLAFSFLLLFPQSYEMINYETNRGVCILQRCTSLSVSSSSFSSSVVGGDISGSVSRTLLTHFMHLALSGSLR